MTGYIKSFLAVCLLLQLGASVSLPKRDSKVSGGITPFSNAPVFRSSDDWTPPGTMYARSVQLNDSSILATWENYSPEPPQVYFPIFRSTDYGRTWSEYSRVEDTERGYGLRYQPHLYVLPGQLGDLPAGTVLISGSAIPTDLSSTHIELYASRDQGQTWEFVSHVADGGEALPNNGLTPIWEPFLFYRDGALTVFYSDQRDPAHGQKLVHQTTTDGVSWGSVVNDVRYSNYTARPGMPTIAQLKNGNWIMTYEYVNDPCECGVPVYYRISDDPLSWDDKTPTWIRPSDGTNPEGTPYVVVGDDGTIIISSNTESAVFVNDGDAPADGWRSVHIAQKRSYTRALGMIEATGSEKQYLSLISGGVFNAIDPINTVTFGVEDFKAW
ncbi:hypothetical protein PMZ80_001197 [Knufia obscura]|uniref:Glycoside hydrolase family 93 protein n=2 Tax=Knufia TaxID=430999 RepID=A0AAN8F2C3_9EURO|nr:hypothetical protein PMZ80_001197 [Knufia obscura]KAK5958741.1 hypothetical protein OHC33_000584 [Knufia fluminis]